MEEISLCAEVEVIAKVSNSYHGAAMCSEPNEKTSKMIHSTEELLICNWWWQHPFRFWEDFSQIKLNDFQCCDGIELMYQEDCSWHSHTHACTSFFVRTFIDIYAIIVRLVSFHLRHVNRCADAADFRGRLTIISRCVDGGTHSWHVLSFIFHLFKCFPWTHTYFTQGWLSASHECLKFSHWREMLSDIKANDVANQGGSPRMYKGV